MHATRVFHEAGSSGRFGVKAEPTLDFAAMMAFKDRAVAGNVKGIGSLFRKNGVELIQGSARFEDDGGIVAELVGGGARRVSAERIVLAPGSVPAAPKALAPDGKRVIDSTGALSLDAPPKRLVVVGAGYIGLEMGSVWARLGTEVVVVEALDRIAPGMDAEVAGLLRRALERQGLAFKLGAGVERLERRPRGVDVVLADGTTEKADYALIAVGRRPDLEGLALDKGGAALDAAGCIAVDEDNATGRAGVWAIGDATSGLQLAHKAMEEGTTLAERFAGGGARMNRAAIPAVAYVHPEVASVGLTEDALIAAQTPYRVGRFPMAASGRGRSMGERDGIVKLLADPETDRLLGGHILAPGAGDMIAQLTLALEFEGAAEDVARVICAHPTFSEMTKEAAWEAAGMAPLHA